MKNIQFDRCDEYKVVEIDAQIDEEGHMMIVPLHVYGVEPFRKIVVAVQIYVCGRLYAMKTRELFTGGYTHCGLIEDFYAGEFEFLFTHQKASDITIQTFAHYIF